jgi:hypothetical protein
VVYSLWFIVFCKDTKANTKSVAIEDEIAAVVTLLRNDKYKNVGGSGRINERGRW